jgi:AbiV family abortive infection protein
MKLDIKTLKLGIIKNLRISQELIDEAEILFKNKKYARTYLLSHIAIEESSKCAMLLKIIAFYIWEEEIDIKNVKKRYSNHKEKIKNFELLKILVDEKDYCSIDLDKQIEILNNFKNESLYVNWSNENEFILPSEIFDKKDAEEKLDSALNYVKLFTSILINLIQNDEEVYESFKISKSNKIATELIKNDKKRKIND